MTYSAFRASRRKVAPKCSFYPVDLVIAIIADAEAIAPIRRAEVRVLRKVLTRMRNHFDLHTGVPATDAAQAITD